MIPEQLARKIRKLAAEAGYTACGFTGIDPFNDFSTALDNLIRRFPETASLYEPMKERCDPAAANPWARSIVVCIRRYGRYRLPEGLADHIGRNYLADSRIEASPDHVMPGKMRDGLRQLGLRVKKGGVPDRLAAARAGIARIGRNCFAYTEHGSWINIETWLTDAELPAGKPNVETPCPDNCRACIRACPTGALVEPRIMRMDRCVAYLTYSAPEPVAPGLWNRMGTWIYGCDACQNACPLNKDKWQPERTMPWLEETSHLLTPQALAEMDDETYRTRVHPLFWYIPADSPARWHRNARRAMENTG